MTAPKPNFMVTCLLLLFSLAALQAKLTPLSSESHFSNHYYASTDVIVGWFDFNFNGTGYYYLISEDFDAEITLANGTFTNDTRVEYSYPIGSGASTHYFHLTMADEDSEPVPNFDEFTIIYIFNQAPRLQSISHPDTNNSYVSRRVDMDASWDAPVSNSDIGIYRYVVDQFPNTIPTTESTATNNPRFSFNVPDTGTWWVHVIGYDLAGNPTQVSHFPVNIRPRRPPSLNSNTHPYPIPQNQSMNFRATWSDSENDSVRYHYTRDQSPDTQITADFSSTTQRKQTLPGLPEGIHYFHVASINEEGTLSETAHFRFHVGNIPAAWQEDNKIVPPEIRSGDLFGNTMAVDGDFALISAPQKFNGENQTGSVFLYQISTRQLLHEFELPNDSLINGFGQTLAMTNDYIVISAPEEYNSLSVGAVYIYDCHNYSLIKKILPPDDPIFGEPPPLYFGHSIAAHGNFLCVGSYDPLRGKAYLFELDSGDFFRELIPLPDVSPQLFYGSNVAIENDIVIVNSGDLGLPDSSMYVFIAQIGHEINRFSPVQLAPFSNTFGKMLLKNGRVLVNDPTTPFVHLFNPTQNVPPEAPLDQLMLAPSEGDSSDGFGTSMAIHDGIAVISAPADSVNGNESGSTYVFDLESGEELYKLTASDGGPGDRYGASVGINEDTILVGAPFAYTGSFPGSPTGSVYIHERAKLEPKTYPVTFDIGERGLRAGGGHLQQNVIENGAAIAPIVAWDGPELEFSRWNRDFDDITGEITVQAIYETARYTVRFELGSFGQHTGGGMLVQEVEAFQNAIAPQVAVEGDRVLTGWDMSFSFVTQDLVVSALYDFEFVANAGAGIRTTDVDDNKQELVTLDGSASIVYGGGSIINYTWRWVDTLNVPQEVIGPDKSILTDVAFPVGTTQVTLEVVDDRNRTAEHEISVLVRGKPSENIYWTQDNNGTTPELHRLHPTNTLWKNLKQYESEDPLVTLNLPRGITSIYNELYWFNRQSIFSIRTSGSSFTQFLDFFDNNEILSDVAAMTADSQCVYWVGDTHHAIFRAPHRELVDEDLKGKEAQEILGLNFLFEEEVRDITTDGRHLYFSVPLLGAIYRANLDGTGESLWMNMSQRYGAGDFAPSGLTADNEYIYWTDYLQDAVYRCDKLGGRPERILSMDDLFGTSNYSPSHIEVTQNNLLWVDRNTIYIADKDGSNAARLHRAGTIHGITALEHMEGKLSPQDELDTPQVTENGMVLLPPESLSPDMWYGFSIAGDGHVFAIGAPGPLHSAIDTGSVHIFRWDGSQWAWEKLIPNDGTTGDRFGFSIAIEENTVAIGAPWANNQTGAVYVMQYNGTTWSSYKLTAPDGAPGDRFGQSVALSEDLVIVGAYQDDSNNSSKLERGSAYIFEWNTMTWLSTKLEPEPSHDFDWFGYSVDVTRNNLSYGSPLIAIGSPGTNSNSNSIDSVHLYHRVDGNWNLLQMLSPNIKKFGDTVRINAHGIFVGARGNRGSVHQYQENDELSWELANSFQANDGQTGDNFGFSLGISDDTLITGAHFDEDTGIQSGSSYLFDLDDPSLPEIKLLSPTPNDGARFGWANAINENIAAIGSIFHDEFGHDSGAVFLYNLESADLGNRLPVAIADNVFNVDENESGLELVTLDARESYDSDGQIVTYEWSWHGILQRRVDVNGSTPNPGLIEAEFPQGITPVTLTVIDEFGGRGSKLFHVVVSVPDAEDQKAYQQAGPLVRNQNGRITLRVELVDGTNLGLFSVQWKLTSDDDWRGVTTTSVADNLVAGDYYLKIAPPRFHEIVNIEKDPAKSSSNSTFSFDKGRQLAVIKESNGEIGYGEIVVTVKRAPLRPLSSLTVKFVSTNNEPLNSVTYTFEPINFPRIDDISGEFVFFHFSGETVFNLDPGFHLLRFGLGPYSIDTKLVPITLFEGEHHEITIQLNLDLPGQIDDSVSLKVIEDTDEHLLNQNPYQHIGSIRSRLGQGSGTIISDRMVLTAAHLLFNNKTMEWERNIDFTHRPHKKSRATRADRVRGIVTSEGYAATRTASDNPQDATIESQEEDYAALFFNNKLGDGGYAGYLVGATDLIESSLVEKVFAGYPVDPYNSSTLGKIHTSGLFNTPLQPLLGSANVYENDNFIAYGGMSGSSLFARHPILKQLYPVAIYLGGRERSIFRIIDNSVVSVIKEARKQIADSNNNNFGIVVTINEDQDPDFDSETTAPINLDAENLPDGAEWYIISIDGKPITEPVYFPFGEPRELLLGKKILIGFKEVEGYETPRNIIVYTDENYKTSQRFPVQYLESSGDEDNDGIANSKELANGTNPFLASSNRIITFFEKNRFADRVSLRINTTNHKSYKILRSNDLARKISEWEVVDQFPGKSSTNGYLNMRLFYSLEPDDELVFYQVLVEDFELE